MKVNELVREYLKENPTMFINKFGVLDFIFFEGGGVVWENGEIEYPGGGSKSSSLEYAMEDLIMNRLDTLRKMTPLPNVEKTERLYSIAIDNVETDLKKGINILLNLDHACNDMSLTSIDESLKDVGYKQTFYDIYKGCIICTIPDNVTDDWLQAIDEFIFIVSQNFDRVDPRSDRNKFEEVIHKIENRVKEIKNIRRK